MSSDTRDLSGGRHCSQEGAAVLLGVSTLKYDKMGQAVWYTD